MRASHARPTRAVRGTHPQLHRSPSLRRRNRQAARRREQRSTLVHESHCSPHVMHNWIKARHPNMLRHHASCRGAGRGAPAPAPGGRAARPCRLPAPALHSFVLQRLTKLSIAAREAMLALVGLRPGLACSPLRSAASIQSGSGFCGSGTYSAGEFEGPLRAPGQTSCSPAWRAALLGQLRFEPGPTRHSSAYRAGGAIQADADQAAAAAAAAALCRRTTGRRPPCGHARCGEPAGPAP